MWAVLESRVKLLAVGNAVEDKTQMGTKPRCNKYDDGYTDALKDVLMVLRDIQRQEFRVTKKHGKNHIQVTID